MMCGTNAHGNVEEARSRGGCGYEGHWNTYLPLIERTTLNVLEQHRTYSSTKKGHGTSMLNSTPGWVAGTDRTGEWMELNLQRSMAVSGIQLQGRDCNTPHKRDWWRIKECTVEFSQDRKTWEAVNEKFQGPEDSWTIVDRMFRRPVFAQYIRLICHSWHEHVAGRFGVVLDQGEGGGEGGGGERKVQVEEEEGEGEGKKKGRDPRRRRNVIEKARDWALKRRKQLQKQRAERTTTFEAGRYK